MKAWLLSVSRNTALDLYRKKKREITGFEDRYFDQVHYKSQDPLDRMILSKYLELLDNEERQTPSSAKGKSRVEKTNTL